MIRFNYRSGLLLFPKSSCHEQPGFVKKPARFHTNKVVFTSKNDGRVQISYSGRSLRPGFLSRLT